MSPLIAIQKAALGALLLGGWSQLAAAQSLIPAEEVGDIMGQYFCLETTGELAPEEVNSLLEEELIALYGAEVTVASMDRLAVLDTNTGTALDDPYAFEVLRQMMRYAVEDDACFRATFFGE